MKKKFNVEGWQVFWISSGADRANGFLNGAIRPQGVAGAAGADGATAAQGAQGVAGDKGADGALDP